MKELWIITLVMWILIIVFGLIAIVLWFKQERIKSDAFKKCFTALKPLKTAREIAQELDPCGRGEFIGEDEATEILENWAKELRK